MRQTISTREDVGRIAQHDLKTPLGSLFAAPALLRAGRTMGAQDPGRVGHHRGLLWQWRPSQPNRTNRPRVR